MKRRRCLRSCGVVVSVVSLLAAAATGVFEQAAAAWDATGHRAITWLAIDAMTSKDAPAFIKQREDFLSIGWQAGEPDRWRGVRIGVLVHENAMDHFLDIEDLEEFGLAIDTISPLRYRYVRDMAVARAVHKDGDRPAATGDLGKREERPPYNERLDPTGQKEWPGFLPHAMAEHHAKLVSAFKTYRQLTALNDPARAHQLAMTKANIMVEMGILSHFVGDAAQPLHTTKHFNGWVGANPNNYTTANTFHAYIDGGVLALHGLNFDSVKGMRACKAREIADVNNPWPEIIAHIKRSHETVERLYELERTGELKQERGKRFIAERLNDGAEMLAGLYDAAWKASELGPKDLEDLVKYDAFNVKDLPGATKEQTPGADAKPGTDVKPGSDVKPAPGERKP